MQDTRKNKINNQR